MRSWARLPLPVLLLFLVVVSAIVRFYAIGSASYWYDELATLHFAGSESWDSIYWDNSPPLFHILFRFWYQACASSEATTRSLSAIFSIAATGLVARIGYELRGKSCALFAGLLQALAPLSIRYAQEARMYSLFEFAAALNLLYFLRLAKNASRTNRMGFFLSGAVLLMTHYFAVVPLVLEATLFGSESLRTRGTSSRLRLISLATVAVFSAVAVIYTVQLLNWQAVGWQAKKFQLEPSSRWPFEMLFWIFAQSPLLLSTFVALTFAALLQLPNRPEQRKFAFLVIAPLVLATGFGFLAERSVFLMRYFIFLIPPYVVWMALVLDDMRIGISAIKFPAEARWAPAALVVLIALLELPQAYVSQKEDWRGAADFLQASRAKVILTSSLPFVRFPYFDQRGLELENWNPVENPGRRRLLDEIRDRGEVWLLEIYTNATYFSELREWAKGQHLATLDKPIETGKFTALFLMRLSLEPSEVNSRH